MQATAVFMLIDMLKISILSNDFILRIVVEGILNIYKMEVLWLFFKLTLLYYDLQTNKIIDIIVSVSETRLFHIS